MNKLNIFLTGPVESLRIWWGKGVIHGILRDYAHQIILGPPDFQTFLRPCYDSSKIAAIINYSRVRNKHTPMLNIFLTFFQGLWSYSRFHRAYFSSISIRSKWGYAYSFCQIFQGLCLFKGLRLFQTLEYFLLLIQLYVSTSWIIN